MLGRGKYCLLAIIIYLIIVTLADTLQEDDAAPANATAFYKLPLTYKSSCNSTNSTITSHIRCAIEQSQARSKSILAKIFGPSIPIFNKSAIVSIDPIGYSQGEYLTSISVGTPRRSVSLIADTGSDLIWLQCLPCAPCFYQFNPIFNPRASVSYRPISCTNYICRNLQTSACSNCAYAYSYGDGSGTDGLLFTDVLGMNLIDGSQASIPNIVFGCGHENNGLFNGAAGILGLGRGPASLMSQVGYQFGYQFSYCLPLWNSASQNSYLVFGRPRSSTINFQYTPMVRNPIHETFYYIELLGISIGNRLLNIPHGTFTLKSDGTGGIILDSGTTMTILAMPAYIRVLQAFSSLISLPVVDGSMYGLDLCYYVNRGGAFPSMVFHFRDANVDLPLDNYFISLDTRGTIRCLAMMGSSDSFSIFGNIQQQNFNLLYDLQNLQVGFALTQCESF